MTFTLHDLKLLGHIIRNPKKHQENKETEKDFEKRERFGEQKRKQLPIGERDSGF